MEKLEGGSIFRVVHGPFPERPTAARIVMTEPQIAHIVKSLLLALNEVHERGYMHCDVKLENLLAGADGSVQLSDFGNTARSPVSYDVGGTDRCTAPEVFRRRRGQWLQCGPSVDIFSTGAVVIDLLMSGRLYTVYPM
ncbi:Protein kinase, partial [Aphelenchoides avenae]